MYIIRFLLNTRLFLYPIKIRYDAGPNIRIHCAFLFQYRHTPHLSLCSHWSAGRQNHGYRGKCYAQQTQRHFCNHHCLLKTLRWRHNDHAGVSNHQPHGCLLNRLFRRKPKKTSKLRVNGLCAGNSPGTGEFPAQMASYAENVSIWWRHHETWFIWLLVYCRKYILLTWVVNYWSIEALPCNIQSDMDA